MKPFFGKRPLRRRTTALLTALAAAVLLLPTAGSAQAATTTVNPGDVTTNWKQFTASPPPGWPAKISGVNDCPAGQRLVGFGAGGTGSVLGLGASSTHFTQVNVLGTIGLISGGFIQSMALCAPSSQFGNVTVKVDRDLNLSTQAGQYIQKKLYCDSGNYAFGGGAYFYDARGYPLAAADVVGNGPIAGGGAWSVTMKVPTGADQLQISTQCAPTTDKVFFWEEMSSVVVSSGTTENRSAYAHCPIGATAIAGGWRVGDAWGNQWIPASQYPGVGQWSIGGPTVVDGQRQSWYASARVASLNRVVASVVCLAP